MRDAPQLFQMDQHRQGRLLALGEMRVQLAPRAERAVHGDQRDLGGAAGVAVFIPVQPASKRAGDLGVEKVLVEADDFDSVA